MSLGISEASRAGPSVCAVFRAEAPGHFYVGRQIYSLDGVRANHFLQHTRVDMLLPLRGPLGVGASAEYFHRRSYYQDAERTIKTYHYPQLRVYLTWGNR